MEGYEIDKEKCCKKYIKLNSYERNIISHVMVASIGIATTALTIAKISSPWILFASSVAYSVAHVIYKDKQTDNYKEQIAMNENEMKLKDEHIRKLSIVNTSQTAGSQTESVKNIDSFELDFGETENKKNINL